jgi:ElaB/YqjD/DUF883 family membrane-anchored ribosome-binding protein
MEQNNYSSSESSTQGQGQGGTTGGSTDGQAAGIKDRARDMAGTAQEKLADVGSTVRDRAGNLKDTLADALETGADKLRSRGGSQGGLAGATGEGSMALTDDGRATEVTNRVAGGMEATADWLRDADMDGIKTGIERQVKEHPGRTLLIAVGLGYLIGKALRK